MIADGDPLPELPEGARVELFAQLGLPDQDDLQELALVRLQVRKEPEKAVPMLERSEKDLPGDYNPPARLALAWKELRQWDKALAASDRALAKAYGPRRLGILRTRAEIYQGKGDLASAKATLERAIAEAEALPDGQKNAGMLAALRKRLESLENPASPS